MAGASKKRRERAASAPSLTLVVCRGGDCGSRAKHPDVDHVGLLARMKDAAGGAARVVPSKCLDACEHSNVVVVVPDDGARGGEPVWVGEVNEPDVNTAICEFARAGGPGSAPMPIEVELQQFHPSRRNRHELETELERSGR